jgi:hypothetical protein
MSGASEPIRNQRPLSHEPCDHDPGMDQLGVSARALARRGAVGAKLGAGGHRWLPDVQPPALDGSPGVGGHTSADLVDYQPRPQGHDPGIDRDDLPRAGPARGRDPLAGMAGHLIAAQQGPASSGRAGRGTRWDRPCRGRRRGGGWAGVAAGHQEQPSGDRTYQRRGRRPEAASVASADRHVIVLSRTTCGQVRP